MGFRIGLIAKLALLVAVLLGGNVAQAARVGDLYTATLLVAEQSVPVDAKLVSQGLEQVLIKVSGQRSTLDHDQIRAGLAQSSRYIQQFSYQATNQSMATDDGRQVKAHRLRIDFEHTLVDRLLSRAGLRALGVVRPGVLVWLMEERNGEPVFLGQIEDPAFASMKQLAQERGLPVFRPRMDRVDQQALPIEDGWNFTADVISQASGRYQADSVLVGRLYPDPDGKQVSQWLLLKASGEMQTFAGDGAGFFSQLHSAVNQAADLLFADFVAPAGALDPGTLLLEVEAVASIDDYFQILQYLEELPAVKITRLQKLEHDRLLLLLEIDGTLSQFGSIIGLNDHFKVLPSYGYDGWLSYRWQR